MTTSRAVTAVAINLVILFMLAGCAATLPPTASVDRDYNGADIKTVSVGLDCTRAVLNNVDTASVPDYCQMLLAATKTAVRRNTGFRIVDGPSDMDISLKLEEMNGGNASLRFWVGFGAGRSVITTRITMVKGGKTVAEGRLVETSTMPSLARGVWSNDEMINQDIGIISGRLADFVANPRDFENSP